ncbi:MAG TPA: septum formation initiator family protein [Bdellovibrionales bacterium]|nr:septum formation initiator family protein [Bdellovibrionales bacterium]
MKHMFRSLWSSFQNLINQPQKVLMIALAVAAVSVVLDGTALRLWSLHRESTAITQRIGEAKIRSHHLKFRIDEAESPQFIERAARDQFDLVKEGDLVFVFADEQGPEVAENSSSLLN